MNLIQVNLLREVAAEVKAKGGLSHFKAHALKNLELRTVLKESHNSPISDLVFNTLDLQHHNLFASVGNDQATIYDDEHMGDFLSVVVQYVNSPTAHHRGGELTCCAWVQMSGITRHELGDACLAVSGPEGVIQIISVVEARVTSLLRGHRGEVVELRGCAGVPGLLASLGADGSVKLWDVASGACLCELSTDAIALEVHPEGRCLFTGHKGGRICRWNLDLDLAGRAPPPQPPPQTAADPDEPSAAPSGASGHERRDPPAGPDAEAPVGQGPCPRHEDGGCQDSPSGSHQPCPPNRPVDPLVLRGGAPAPEPLQLQLSGAPLGDYVDCLRWLPSRGGLLAAKSSDGRLAVWELGGEAARSCGEQVQVLALRVPGTHPPGGGKGGGLRCRFSATRDGAFICVGNPAGDAYVYDTSTGARAAHYSSQKIRGPARAAALSEDGRHLLTAHGSGFICRYEYIRKPASAPSADAQQGNPKQEEEEGQPAEGGAAAAAEIPEPGDGASPAAAVGLPSSREPSPDPGTGDDGGGALQAPAAMEAEPGGAGSGPDTAVPDEGALHGGLGTKRSWPGDGRGEGEGERQDGGEDGPGGKRLKAQDEAGAGCG